MSQRELNSHPCHYPKELKLRPTRLKAEPFAKPDGDGASLDFSISLCVLAILKDRTGDQRGVNESR